VPGRKEKTEKHNKTNKVAKGKSITED